jgi:uncharacterized membrane protein
MSNSKINHLAVIVCVVLLHALGFLWYGFLFQEKWMSLVGLDMAKIEANQPGASVWLLNFVAIVAPLYLLAWLFTKLNVVTGGRGAVIGFLIAFCFHHLWVMNNNMFAMAPYALAWIVGGYNLVSFTLSGFILGAWTRKTA